MSLELTQLNADIDNMIDDLPLTVAFNGHSVSGTRSTLRRSVIMTMQGLEDQYQFSVYTRASTWTSPPDNDDLVTIAGVQYRVLNHEYDAPLQLLRLDLGEKFANA